MEVAHSGFFVLRTPLLPAHELVQWSDLDGVSGFDTRHIGESESVWHSAVAVFRDRLRKVVVRPEVRHALFVASPSLDGSLKYWFEEPDSKKGLQTERALVRYFSRMCTRSTPFGLFAGCSLGLIQEAHGARLCLEPTSQYRSVSRLDFDYLYSLTAALMQDRPLRSDLKYRPNSSLHRIGENWHYVQSRIQGTTRSHHLVKLVNDDPLAAVLERAREGASVPELIAAIPADPAEPEPSTTGEADEYVQDLIDNDVLVSSLSPLITGESPVGDLISQLSCASSGLKYGRILQSVKESMEQLDCKGLGVAPEEYGSIMEKLRALPARVDPKTLFQIDLFKPASRAFLSESIVKEIAAAARLLCQIGQAPELEELRQFCEAFTERYEGAWVPLLEALDDEVGIGFGLSAAREPSPLLRELPIGQSSRTKPLAFSTLMLRKLLTHRPSDNSELVFDPSELPAINGDGLSVPTSFSVWATLIAESAKGLTSGDYQICLNGAYGPGAAMIGRFCHTEKHLDDFVRRHLREEEALDPKSVYAEVVYAPEGRVGNIICRPVLRDYEIVYLARSGAPAECQLPASDLLISVGPDNRIRLRSQRLGREVVPRLTSAHAYMNQSLAPLYRLLTLMQSQNGSAIIRIDWGVTEDLEYLPRVRIGRVVIAKQRWRLSSEELRRLDGRQCYQSFCVIQDIRRRRGLPRWIEFVQADNALAIDLDNPLSVDTLVHVALRAKSAVLREMYPSPSDLCVTGPEGLFFHEILIPFCSHKHQAATQQAFRGPTAEGHVTVTPRVARSFPPASEWVYVKLYSGVSTQEELLIEWLPAILRRLNESELISSWFYVRYADPKHHLRLRFRAARRSATRDLPHIVLEAIQPLVESGRIWKTQLDTYEREIERYGGIEGIQLAEQIFSADSDAVLHMLQVVSGDSGVDLRWRLAVLSVDCLLRDCKLSLGDRYSLLATLRENYGREILPDIEARRKLLGERFRAARRGLEAILDNPTLHNPALAPTVALLNSRSRILAEPMQRLSVLARNGGLSVSIANLAMSYAHMHVNRLIPSAQRAHEAVIYDFLWRLYDSRLARQTRSKMDLGIISTPEITQLVE